MRERNVPKSVLFKLIKSKRPFGLLGFIFTSLALFVFLPMTLIMTATSREPHEKYDFDAIDKNGSTVEGIVTGAAYLTNVTVNGRHPIVISYSYSKSGTTRRDMFQTFDLDKAQNLAPGATVEVKEYRGQSVITGMEPYVFPVYLIMFGPFVFLVIGIIFLLIALIPALKKYRLYKSGMVKDAEIISMAPTSFGVRGMHRQSLLVNYFFTGRNGTKVFGESVTDEYSLLHENKSGDLIKVFVSEEDDSQNCIVPKLESLKYNWNI